MLHTKGYCSFVPKDRKNQGLFIFVNLLCLYTHITILVYYFLKRRNRAQPTLLVNLLVGRFF